MLSRGIGLALATVCSLAVATSAADVWTPNPCAALYEGEEAGGRDDPACAIRLMGARNDAVSGCPFLGIAGKDRDGVADTAGKPAGEPKR
jgi:hypothetical protein